MTEHTIYRMTPEDRDDTWLARRIARATPGGRTDRALRKKASDRVLRLVDVLSDLDRQHCQAEADRRAAEAVR